MIDPLDIQIALEHFDLHSDRCPQTGDCEPNCCHNPGLVSAIEEMRNELRAWHLIADALYSVIIALPNQAVAEMAELILAFSTAKSQRSKL